MANDNEPISAVALSPTPEKRSFVTRVLPYITRTTITIAPALESALGVLAPEKATQLRDIVLMLPPGSGDLVN